jgi:putative hemolysin
MSQILVDLLVIVLLVALNALFVAAEIALITVRRSRVDQLAEDGERGALRVQRLIADPGRFLAVIQVGITFVGFLASAFAAVSLVELLDSALQTLGIPAGYSAPVSLLAVTILLSGFTIVFGELVPKTLALAHPERFALTFARPVDILGRLLGPVVRLLTSITAAITRPLGADVNQEAQISAEELKLIVERGGEQGILEAEEEQMIHAVIELGERRLHEVMVPRIDMVALAADASFEDAIDLIVGGGHSRIPVYEGTVDEIVGILYAKDLLTFLKGGSAPRPTLRALLRTPVFVPESMTIDDLLHEFQRRKVHLAIVLDEYGGTAGLVTIEDLLEEIVGEIQDEYDVEEPMVEKLSDDEARIDGRASIDDLAEAFDLELELEDDDEYDTVGGLIFHRLGDVPEPGDRITVEALTLTVESIDGRRVAKVLVVRDRGEGDGPPDHEADR